ncbi:metallophosphoesterase [Sneathiella chinensis]|uniref:Metallophosphoesterase n=1 Tax=Sneathiella chinensis TaxID=349750 RepID=A0ABQ5U7M2_9PROT|nr:metallophosphoesterase [Sneathiella chinensis]GLQ07904.1 metallophosphoesterase [Sneathiella chinensis]
MIFGSLKKKQLPVRLPDGERIIAIGDLHGQLPRLKSVLKNLRAYRKKNPAAFETIIFLGDYVDRGLQSAQLIDYLIAFREKATNAGARVHFLKGNHEVLLLNALADPEADAKVWIRNGGLETVASYLNGGIKTPSKGTDLKATLHEFQTAVPPAHRDFFKSLELFQKQGPFIFVHAGIRMERKMKDQKEADLLWIRGPFLDWSGPRQKRIVVHGHSITNRFEPELYPHRLAIDTGSYLKKGRITAAIFEKDMVRFVQNAPGAEFSDSPFS